MWCRYSPYFNTSELSIRKTIIMEQYYFKANTQLMARCIYNQSTGKVTFENLSKYYPTLQRKRLFN